MMTTMKTTNSRKYILILAIIVLLVLGLFFLICINSYKDNIKTSRDYEIIGLWKMDSSVFNSEDIVETSDVVLEFKKDHKLYEFYPSTSTYYDYDGAKWEYKDGEYVLSVDGQNIVFEVKKDTMNIKYRSETPFENPGFNTVFVKIKDKEEIEKLRKSFEKYTANF